VVKQGDKILSLGNTNLLLDIMWREAELFQQSNNLRNTRLQMEQYRLQLNQELASIDNQLKQQKRTYERYQELMKDNLISQHEFDLAKDQYEYLVIRRELTIESQTNELEFRQSQIEALESSLRRMQDNLEVVKQKQENLTIRAPISGHLTALDAEIGQSKAPGLRIGQIDVMDAFKVRVPVDEHYIARVEQGRGGTFDFAGNTYDMLFPEEVPQGIRRGMSLHIRLEMGDISDDAILLAKGGFFQTTGGNWVYVLDNSAKIATKRPIRLGMSNAYVHEILEGLQPGEKVITSSYESFGNHERLILK
jgi:HlyD family secretion protein